MGTIEYNPKKVQNFFFFLQKQEGVNARIVQFNPNPCLIMLHVSAFYSAQDRN
jgi:hypothetical protein